jgi:2-dehydro-3-deoxyphosphogluconate aldolase/(4S)-4-hydroxy-2-oxoglutarate aldolase
MSDKEKNLKDMLDCGVVAIVRVGSAREALEVCEAIAAGGIRSIEITMTVPGAIDAIKQFATSVKDDILVGAGTVLDAQAAGAAITAGAEFIVSPTLNLEVIKVCRRYSKIAIPGTFTPTEILTAWEAGGDIIKVFPATVGGPQYLRDIRGPLPQVRLCPTGGVSLENTPDFIKAGAAVVAAGTSLVEKKALSEKKYGVITENARRFMEAVRLARGT